MTASTTRTAREFWTSASIGLRLLAVLMLVTLAPCAINYWLSHGLLGSYDRQAFGASGLFGLFMAHRMQGWLALGV